MLASKERNGRKFSPSHIDEKIQAKLISIAISSTAYIFRRVLRMVGNSVASGTFAGGIIGEARIRLNWLHERQF